MRIYLALLGLCVILFSCSKLSVGVYWADTFALSQIDDYFVMDSAQEEKAKAEFQAAFRQVRQNEFIPMAKLLEEMAAEVEGGSATIGKLETWSKTALAILQRGAGRFENLGQMLVAQQAASGIKRFDEEFAKKHREQGEKLSSEKGRLKQAKKRIERVVSETFGSLNAEQEALVEQTLKDNPLLLEHQNRGELFEQFKRARVLPETRVEFLRKYFQDWESLQSKEYLKARDAYQKSSRELMLQLLASASPEQKKNLVDNFRKRAGEMKKLAVVE